MLQAWQELMGTPRALTTFYCSEFIEKTYQ
jgi:hypothetical protein